MHKDIAPEWIVTALAAQGVATDAARAQTYAALLGVMLKGAAPGYAQLAFEEEPASYIAAQRSNAP